MYDAEYQIPAQIWINNASRTHPTSTPDRPSTNVTTNISNQKIQANLRVLENIFLHCLLGPIKNPVAAMAMKLPNTYNMAKFVTRFFQGSLDNNINVPMKLNA